MAKSIAHKTLTKNDEHLHILLIESHLRKFQYNCSQKLMELTEFFESSLVVFLKEAFHFEETTGEKHLFILEDGLVEFQKTCTEKMLQLAECFNCGGLVEQIFEELHHQEEEKISDNGDGLKLEQEQEEEDYTTYEYINDVEGDEGGENSEWSDAVKEYDEPISRTVSSQLLDTKRDQKKYYDCDICGKRLATKQNCKFHLRTHTREDAFECDICKKHFVLKQSLKIHMRTHSKEHPYMCHVCSRTFKQSAPFHRHMRAHTNEKPFPCPNCNRAFIEKTYLKVHMQSHTGERPHVCPVCQRGYSKRYHVRQHLKNFHMVKDLDAIFPHNQRKARQ